MRTITIEDILNSDYETLKEIHYPSWTENAALGNELNHLIYTARKSLNGVDSSKIEQILNDYFDIFTRKLQQDNPDFSGEELEAASRAFRTNKIPITSITKMFDNKEYQALIEKHNINPNKLDAVMVVNTILNLFTNNIADAMEILLNQYSAQAINRDAAYKETLSPIERYGNPSEGEL